MNDGSIHVWLAAVCVHNLSQKRADANLRQRTSPVQFAKIPKMPQLHRPVLVRVLRSFTPKQIRERPFLPAGDVTDRSC